MGAIAHAFNSIGDGIKHAFEGLGQIVKGVFTLDLNGIAAGAKEMVHGGMQMSRGMVGLTPAAACANTLLDGAVDRMIKQIEGMVEQVFSDVVDQTAAAAQGCKHGIEQTLHGIATGNVGQMVNGVLVGTLSAAELTRAVSPQGLVQGIGMAALDGAVGKIVPPPVAELTDLAQVVAPAIKRGKPHPPRRN